MDRGKLGSEHHQRTDADSTPLVAVVIAAPVNDGTMLLPLVGAMPRVRAKIGPPRRRRVTSVSVSNPTVASYFYTGQAMVVGTTLDQAAVHRRMYATPATTGVYPGLDRFDRVVSDLWVKDLATDETFDSRTIAYDRDSNITRVEDNIHTAGAAGSGNGLFDVAYTMDDRNRLTRAYEGNWNGSVINSAQRDQQWLDGSGNAGLSQTGGWARSRLDLDGNGVWPAVSLPPVPCLQATTVRSDRCLSAAPLSFDRCWRGQTRREPQVRVET